jgi:hypothetical protein
MKSTAMERHSLFPMDLPARLAGSFADQPIQINGMEVEFDEKVALFPVQVEVEKVDGQYYTRPTRASGNGQRPGRSRRRNGSR